MKLFNIRNIIIVVFILLFIIGLGYKYYEWNTLQNLNALYNQTWTQELSLVQNENKSSQPYSKLFQKVFLDKNYTGDTLINSYPELSGDLQVIISNQEDYRSTIEQNNAQYANYITWFLFGKRGDFAKKLVSDQHQYYQYEISDANITDAQDWLIYNQLTAWRDSAVVDKFSKEVSPNYATLIPKYWTDLSLIQKYSNANFAFDHQDEIKKYYPNAYAELANYQNYFSSFYSIMQDAVNGGTQPDQSTIDSITYKLPSLTEARTSLNVNISDLLNETKDQSNSNAKNIIQIVSDESNAVKDFKANNLFKYPLLSDIGSWKEDLVLCQMYDFKAGLHHGLTTNYITAKNPSALLSELSVSPPDTQFVDNRFDKSSMMLVNNDKQIIFTCFDKSNKSSYQFITNK